MADGSPHLISIIVSSALTFSIALNLILFYSLKRKPLRSPKQSSQELQEFIADLAGGGYGVVTMRRVDPGDILLRSPKRQK